MTYICKIELNDIAPKIWRQFQFHPEITFHQLHKIIQIVMGWEDYHLYEFEIGGRVIGLPDPTYADMETREVLNARREIVIKHLQKENTEFSYTYDFGDNWRHTIKLEQMDTTAFVETSPMCLGGERSCPQEDVGGIWGHQHMMEALFTPNHPEYDEFKEWLKEGYDPETFRRDEVNDKLRQRRNKLIPKSLLPQAEDKKPVKLTKTALNKHLKRMSQEQLIELVKECYGSSKDMERMLAVKILGEEALEPMFHEYRKKVEHEFFPQRGHGKLRLQEAKKAISEFEKLTGNEKYTLELKLFYVEMGVSFTLTYGDIDDRFYDSMEAVYADVIRTVNFDDTAELFEEYEERISAIVSDTKGIGWGFHDSLSHMHERLRWM
ncbi:plasmid pRiA4b ORF-3 family protein [Paenibacillus alkaliterrae]|uniref:DUF6155 family protein n=1 Tax=Paenibacillus alkaliterrae TaxID=320909 RepID=UPI001F3BAC1A|nr:DUF6155 family protein [Paenibacillus alkaliterrae]MCF2939469.1 plasmid pRiA4b ORF-3 family protein [Paenibacillus alkaliterrae]